MTNPTDTKSSDLLDCAREQGRLSGEVRMLKWAVSAAFVALIAALGAIYTEMNQGFREVNGRIDELALGVTDVRERLTRVEGSVERIDEHIGELRAARTPQAPESPT